MTQCVLSRRPRTFVSAVGWPASLVVFLLGCAQGDPVESAGGSGSESGPALAGTPPAVGVNPVGDLGTGGTATNPVSPGVTPNPGAVVLASPGGMGNVVPASPGGMGNVAVPTSPGGMGNVGVPGGMGSVGPSNPGGAGNVGEPSNTAGMGNPSLAGGGSTATSTPDGVSFATPSQTFRDELVVEMTTGVVGAEIRYTTDGTPPSPSATLYTAPLTLTATTQVRAQPFTGGAPSGSSNTAIYIARTFDATSTLPIVLIDGYGGGESTDKTLYLDAAIMVFEPVDGTASLANLPTLATRAGYRLRGQSSATFEQRPYRIEFWDEANADRDAPLLGMPADSDWALIPPFYDRSLLRTPFTYSLGKALGLQAPRTAFGEVYVNYEARALGENDYQGIYWVSEVIKNNEVRTNLKQLDETNTTLPEISGGYILKFEQFAAEEPTLTCTGSQPLGGGFGAPAGGGTCWHSLEVADPDPVNAEQQAWITDYIQQFHDALHATPIGDYGAYIDVASFVDYFLITELSRNMDAYVRSANYHKDRDGKLIAGPLWDYNFAFGAGSPEVVDPAGDWQVNAGRNVNNWYQMLLTDPAFTAAVQARWQVVRQAEFSEASMNERIATLIAPLGADAIAKDLAKWPMSFFTERAGRSTVPVTFPMADTFEGQLQALRDFLAARANRMDVLVNEL